MRSGSQNKGATTPGRRLYLTADGSRVVEEGDTRAASLYCSEFGSVQAADLVRLTPKKKTKQRKG